MQYLFDIKPFTKTNNQDYLLIIPPGHDIASKIMYFKLKVWEMIGDYPSLYSTAHISINHDNDIRASVFEEKLSYYKRKIAHINAFEVKVYGFGHFRHGNTYTIYAKAEISGAVKETLFKLNRTFSKGVDKTPHIAIAKTISKDKFDIVWPYFKDLEFEYSFYADKINVLETPTRKFHNFRMQLKTELTLQP